tara:strand:+ start:359 stop:535 length:177 start_codon:yes stop_codon:yes gene_type:complete
MDAFLDKRLVYRIQHLLQPTHLGAGQAAAIKELMPTEDFPWISVMFMVLGIVFFMLSR